MSKMSKSEKSFLALFILCIGIGFAFLSGTININGVANVYGNKWDVHFQNVQVSAGSVSSSLPVIDENKTTVTCTVNLEEPGDFYEFTVEVANGGTFNAIIDSIDKTELDEATAKYLNYVVTYEDGSEIKKDDLLIIGNIKKYKIRVEFKKDITISDLERNDKELTLSFEVNYIRLKTEVQIED